MAVDPLIKGFKPVDKGILITWGTWDLLMWLVHGSIYYIYSLLLAVLFYFCNKLIDALFMDPYCYYSYYCAMNYAYLNFL